MPRGRRNWIDPELGGYHVISRVGDSSVWFDNEEKEYFLTLLELYSKSFFVEINAFCFMSNHFHLLVTGMEKEAERASVKDLENRYCLMYGKNVQFPVGSIDRGGEVEVDGDYGLQRLRERLGSVPRFVQELKQSFGRWYNKKHKRKGFLWGERYKSVLVSHGDAQLICSAYIDLNPIRAQIKGVSQPEDYRWSSIGLKARSPRRANQILQSVEQNRLTQVKDYNCYRQFVYTTGAIKVRNKRGQLSETMVKKIVDRCGKLGVAGTLRYRSKNLSEGIAFGDKDFIAELQKRAKRKFVRPRVLFADGGEEGLCTTRIFRKGDI